MSPPAVGPRTPILVGVGTAFADAEPVELMVQAARACGFDAGPLALLRTVQEIAVPRGTWTYSDPARIVAARIGAPHARTVLVNLGIPQQSLINRALTSIATGELDVVLVVGAEARARAARAAKAQPRGGQADMRRVLQRDVSSFDVGELDQGAVEPDVVVSPAGTIVAASEIEAGLVIPVEQYAMIDSALRFSSGESVIEHQREIAELWTRFNRVSATNSEAAFPAPIEPEDLVALGPQNRPLAFPYGKWHASQWTVDQGAALLLCSAAAAERAGVPQARWTFPLVGLESSHEVPLVNRRDLHTWPAMGVLGRAASRRLGWAVNECDNVELYSCFPAAVRVQQRELGLPPGGTPTITGGMTFAGGPFNSFVLHATAAMARRLRQRGGTGLVTTVSGLLTKPGVAVWASEPDGSMPLVDDLAEAARDATPTVEAETGYNGRAAIAACTVTYEAGEPAVLVAILDTAERRRVIARSRSLALVRRAIGEELIGTTHLLRGPEIVG